MLTRRELMKVMGSGIIAAGALASPARLAGDAVATKDNGGVTPAQSAPAPATAENPFPRKAAFHDGRDWFLQKRFGMFVHWGIFSVAGYDTEELIDKRTPREEYEPYMHQFNPVKFNPDAWLDLAQQTGMEYLTFTTKHIDGFCMWDTQQTNFNIMHTPYGKDTLKLLSDACHRRNFPLSLYYSIVDEHQRNYPNTGKPYELAAPAPGDDPDEEKYLAFVRRQVQELCTKYGEIHGFWWDGNVLKRKDPSFNALIRSLQPKAVINNRGFDDGDYGTPERDWDSSVNTEVQFAKPVEACQSVGYQSWGYREDEDYYTVAHLIRSVQKVMAKGGNYLLNVGPKPDGTIPAESAHLLQQIGKWYAQVKESLVGVEPASMMTDNRSVVLTRRADTVYVHLIDEPETAAVYLHPLRTLPLRATVLNTGARVECDVLTPPRFADAPVTRSLRLKNLPVSDGAVGMVIKLEFAAGLDDPKTAG